MDVDVGEVGGNEVGEEDDVGLGREVESWVEGGVVLERADWERTL